MKKINILIIIVSITLLIMCTIAESAEYVPETNNRLKINFNHDWKFIKETPAGSEYPPFDDDSWEDVGLPHSYNDMDEYDDWAHGFTPADGNMWTGQTMYRKHFTIDGSYSNHKVYLEFEAVRAVADVWINGNQLPGQYKSGFSPFGWDITDYIIIGTENIIAVRADNTSGEITTEIPGNDSHWHGTFGGIWQNVWLHLTDKCMLPCLCIHSCQQRGPTLQPLL